jgi:L-amino acid N-acyltransferase YncA
MPDKWRIRPLQPGDSEGVRAIFNFYVEHSFAAYADHPLSQEDIEALLASSCGYPALAIQDEVGDLIGFGFLRPYSPHSTFAGTAMVTYFIASGHTGEGLGTALLQELEARALERGIRHLLAHVSSRNEASLVFQTRHGFEQCGCFHDIGHKHNQAFDIVWFEKALSSAVRLEASIHE